MVAYEVWDHRIFSLGWGVSDKKYVMPDGISVWEARLVEIFCAGAPKSRLGAFRG
jgi:hypothetical protein